jgi:putative addiction module component (TIGR02574 family)
MVAREVQMTKEQIFTEAMRLARTDQLDLAAALLDGTSEAPKVSPEMGAELDRRLAAHRANPAPTEDWDVYRARVLRGEI